MIRYLIALMLAAAAAAPAAAQDLWRHQASGVSIPRVVGEMRLSQERDASGGGNYDVILQFGDSTTPATIYIYRSAYPNPALWFERTRMAMNQNVGSQNERVAPDSLTLGNARAPNGLREDIAISGGGRFRATSVAIAQAGEWMVKVRLSSTQLDRDAVASRMSQLLAALRFENMPPPHPLIVPALCSESTGANGRKLSPGREAVAAAARDGVLVADEARGRAGLAMDPRAWCRESTQFPAQYGSVYRRRDGGAWVALVGDAGRAISAATLGDRAVTFAAIPASTSLVAVYEGLPHPDRAIVEAIPIVTGQARGLAEVPALRN